jgi:hypothetical protein
MSLNIRFSTPENQTAWQGILAWLQGDPQARVPILEEVADLQCSDLKERLEEALPEATLRTRYRIHYLLGLYRDLRYSTTNSQYVLRMAAYNSMRSHYEMARVHQPLADEST